MPIALIFALLMGASIGSFLNVVAYRLPLNQSLSTPASHCPSCETPIKPYDNIPVVGWLMLRGKCRSCGVKISPRYPLVEAFTALMYLAVVAARWDSPRDIALGVALVTLLVPMSLIDLETRLIPNKLLLPFVPLALVLGAIFDPSYLPEQLIAGAGAFAFFFVAAWAYPKGMGMGDVKLAGVLGLYLGSAVVPGIFIGLIAGVVVGAIIMARLGTAAGRKTAVPFGPFLALGAAIAIFAGHPLVDAYLNTF